MVHQLLLPFPNRWEKWDTKTQKSKMFPPRGHQDHGALLLSAITLNFSFRFWGYPVPQPLAYASPLLAHACLLHAPSSQARWISPTPAGCVQREEDTNGKDVHEGKMQGGGRQKMHEEIGVQGREQEDHLPACPHLFSVGWLPGSWLWRLLAVRPSHIVHVLCEPPLNLLPC